MLFRLVMVGAAFLAMTAPADKIHFEVEPNHTTMGFAVSIAGGVTRVTGKFMDFDVDIVWNEADVTQSSVAVDIRTASIDTGIADRDAHLRTADFFHADKYPSITFDGRQIQERGDAYVVIGELSMHGVTKEVELPFEVTRFGEESKPMLAVTIRSTINRQDFGVGSGWQHSVIPDFIGDEVQLEIDLWTRIGKRE